MNWNGRWVPPVVKVNYSKADEVIEGKDKVFDSIFKDFSVFLDAVPEYAEVVISRCEEGNYPEVYEETILMYLEDDSMILGKAELAIPLPKLGITLDKVLTKLEEREEYEKCARVYKLLERYNQLDLSKSIL